MVFERIFLATRFWWKHFLPLLLVGLPFAIVGAGIQVLVGQPFVVENDQPSANLTSAALLMFLQVLAEGAIICQLDSLSKGRARNLFDCLLFSLYVLPRLALVMLATVAPLAIAIAMGVQLAGGPGASLVALVILPGIWAYLRLSLAGFSVALDRLPIVTALGTSLRRTQPQQWPLLTAWLLLLLLVLMASASVNGILVAALGDQSVGLMAGDIIQKMLGILVTVLLFQAWRMPSAARPD